MAAHVAQHFLHDAKHRHRQALGQLGGGGHVHVPAQPQLGAVRKLLHLPLQRGPQALVVEDAGAQVGDDAAHVVHGGFDQAAHVLALAAHALAHVALGLGAALGLLGQALVHPVHVHFQGHQQAAQLVMHLAGNAGALVFAHAFGAGGQLAHLGQRGLQRQRAFAHPRLQLGLGLAQRIGGPPALGDVGKRDHRAPHRTLIDDGVAGILHRKRAAIAPPEHLSVDAAGQPLAKGVEDGTEPFRIGRAVGPGVVCDVVHVAPQQLGRLVADHLRPGGVDEHAQPVQIDPVDALASGGQHQPQRIAPHLVGRRGGATGGVAGR